MRIITGKYKGRRLLAAPDKSIRPAMDVVKGSIFNSLQSRYPIGDARVLDLFAGTGSLGFEALSRGAAEVTFVDDQTSALDVIEENARNLECLEQCTLVCDDALAFARREKGEYGLVFADPPYAYPETPLLPGAIFERGLLGKAGFLIIEHAKRTEFSLSPLYRLALRKEFGATHLSFFVHA
ncbi:MAG TPA: 16S rRNA (guanine(966)-N(2))-methyltransferase RsmD [Bacteroidota bacterium]